MSFSIKSVLDSYKTGLVVRAIDPTQKSVSHETTTGLTWLNSATYIEDQIGIDVYYGGKMALIFDPNKLVVPFAFKENACTGLSKPTKGRDLSIVQDPDSKKDVVYITDSDGKCHKRRCYTSGGTIDAIKAKVHAMFRKIKGRSLETVELLIKAKEDLSDKKDAIIGVIIEESMTDLRTLSQIHELTKQYLPGRSFYSYSSHKRILSPIDIIEVITKSVNRVRYEFLVFMTQGKIPEEFAKPCIAELDEILHKAYYSKLSKL